MEFFSKLPIEKDWKEWAQTFDWLFHDERFPKERGWDSSLVGKFTNRIKKMEFFAEGVFEHGSAKKLIFPKTTPKSIPTVIIGTNESQGRDLMRHIRNGIAHGRVKVLKQEKTVYVEIVDMKATQQTAYLYVPYTYILGLYQIYKEMEHAIKNDRSNRSIKRKYNNRGRAKQRSKKL